VLPFVPHPTRWTMRIFYYGRPFFFSSSLSLSTTGASADLFFFPEWEEYNPPSDRGSHGVPLSLPIGTPLVSFFFPQNGCRVLGLIATTGGTPFFPLWRLPLWVSHSIRNAVPRGAHMVSFSPPIVFSIDPRLLPILRR